MIIRILASVLLLFSILFMSFWVSVVLAFGAMIYFNVFWEATVLFLLLDLLYGTKEVMGFPVIFIHFILALIFLIIIETVKKKKRFHPNS